MNRRLMGLGLPRLPARPGAQVTSSDRESKSHHKGLDLRFFSERATRFELATLTLAR